jgi:hypothetical protein
MTMAENREVIRLAENPASTVAEAAGAADLTVAEAGDITEMRG